LSSNIPEIGFYVFQNSKNAILCLARDRIYAIICLARYMLSPVCPSVCLSHGWISQNGWS